MQIEVEVKNTQTVEIPQEEVYRIIRKFIKEEFDLEPTDAINKDGEIERLEVIPNSPYGRIEDRQVIRGACAYDEVILQFLQILDAREKGKKEFKITNSEVFDNTWGVTKISKEEIDKAHEISNPKDIDPFIILKERTEELKKKNVELQKELEELQEKNFQLKAEVFILKNREKCSPNDYLRWPKPNTPYNPFVWMNSTNLGEGDV
jgi:FtsZ-binding cell division protein ZapB